MQLNINVMKELSLNEILIISGGQECHKNETPYTFFNFLGRVCNSISETYSRIFSVNHEIEIQFCA